MLLQVFICLETELRGCRRLADWRRRVVSWCSDLESEQILMLTDFSWEVVSTLASTLSFINRNCWPLMNTQLFCAYNIVCLCELCWFWFWFVSLQTRKAWYWFDLFSLNFSQEVTDGSCGNYSNQTESRFGPWIWPNLNRKHEVFSEDENEWWQRNMTEEWKLKR